MLELVSAVVDVSFSISELPSEVEEESDFGRRQRMNMAELRMKLLSLYPELAEKEKKEASDFKIGKVMQILKRKRPKESQTKGTRRSKRLNIEETEKEAEDEEEEMNVEENTEENNNVEDTAMENEVEVDFETVPEENPVKEYRFLCDLCDYRYGTPIQ